MLKIATRRKINKVLAYVLTVTTVISCMFFLSMLPDDNNGFSLTAHAANTSTKTNNLEFLNSLRNDRTVNAYTVPLAYDVYAYSDYKLTKRANMYLSRNTSYKVQIIGAAKSYKSVMLKNSKGQSGWFPARVILGSVDVPIYNYQLTSNINYYSGSNCSSKKGTISYNANQLGTANNDVTVLGGYGNYISVYKNGDIYIVKPSELFKGVGLPKLITKSGYYIQPKVDKSGYYFNNYQLFMRVKNGSKNDKASVVVNNILTYFLGKDVQWEISYCGDGFYTIKNCKSGKYLNVAGGSTNSGADLWQYWYDGTDAMKFQIIKNSNGFYFIRSKLGTYVDLAGGKTSDGTNVQLYTGNRTNAQRWRIW